MEDRSKLSHLRHTNLNTFYYGSPYYPEHWDEEVRVKDPELLAAAGWNVIRMAEFAWDRIEPKYGEFDFSLFDETIERFGEVGIKTILCTPTATPPIWLTEAHPEILRVDDKGIKMEHGSRQHASHFSPVFREHSRRITAAMAKHYADNPNVVGWQTDNEFHCHFSEDHSASAQRAWHEFLSERFEGDIQKLNTTWGTAFWAQTYTRFEQVPTPKRMRPTYSNPAQELDYRRFLDWGVTRFQKEQVDILREANPLWFVTHNGCFYNIDFRGQFTKDLDFLGFDMYPHFFYDPDERPARAAYWLDMVRSFSGNFLVLEHQSGPGGQGGYFHDNPEPGEMRKMAWMAIAHGADGMLLFRERCCRFGAEEYWCGVLDHDNVPRRRYREAAILGKEIAELGPQLLGTSVHQNIGIACCDFIAENGHDAMTLGLPDPRDMGKLVHQAFYERGYDVGVVHPEDDLSGLDVLLVAHLSLFDPLWCERLSTFVEKGGTLVIGARTASKDRNNNVVPDTLPGVLRSLAGVTVEEYGRQNMPEKRPLELSLGNESWVSDLWYEALSPDEGTDVVGTWQSRHLAGQAAVTCRSVGKGKVYYVGTYFTDTTMPRIVNYLAEVGDLPDVLTDPKGVERIKRYNGTQEFCFLINHREEAVSVEVPSGESLLGHTLEENTILLGAYDVAIVRINGRDTK
ncbi:beta-galactosidase [Pelagicoccus albus]|uniref:Beta-galactosidase n=1 Tax=Pelagicoccus albus TaxID=415222 RepID=A0A7X1B610_9BACT|nr:beta-galactosidase [Pelagicoccus albus]MBC2605040.1 beta-galactosidase [Pelagicoccus albus]